MRRRLLAAFLALTTLILVLFVVPRAIIVAERAREAEQRDIERIAATIAGLVDARGSEPMDTDQVLRLLVPGDQAVITSPDGRKESVGVPEGTPELRASAADSRGVTVEVTRSDAYIQRRVRDALLSLAAISGGVIAVAIVVASVLARRLAQPFVALAHAATRLGDGSFDLPLPRTSIDEAIAIRDSMERSAERLHSRFRREREFASNASHQLRTPLTSLRLRLEDLTYWPQIDEGVRAELESAIADVDRLSETVSGLLGLAREGQFGEPVAASPAEAVRAAHERWRVAAQTAGRTVQLGRLEAADPAVEAPPGAIAQVLDVLVHNALEHGQGDVTLSCLASASAVRLLVEDQGAGIPDTDRDEIFERNVSRESGHGAGIGLALAREVAASMGAKVVVGSTAPTTFEVVFTQPQTRPGAAEDRLPGG